MVAAICVSVDDVGAILALDDRLEGELDLGEPILKKQF